MARYLQKLFWATVVLMWTPVVAWAGAVAVTGGDLSPLAVPPVLMFGSFVLSTLAGATTLAMSIAKELRANPGQPLIAPWWNAGAHMGGSWLAGSAAFIGSMVNGSGFWTLLGAVLLSSFIGSKGLELWAQKFLPGYTPKEG